jgi:4a-hydroxytetrahydrobiopterin dehydratase
MAALSDSDIEDGLKTLDGWSRDGDAIVREIELDDFEAALALLNAVAGEAQARDHHPDMLLHGWNKLGLTLSTHSEGGITEKDLELAAAIDALQTR